MNAKVQLLPLRYGLTEGVDPSAELAMPFALKSRPLGLRLVRNGYLYVIDGGTGKLHEYRIDKGAIDKLLWQDAEVRADVRSRAVGEPQLVFPVPASCTWPIRSCNGPRASACRCSPVRRTASTSCRPSICAAPTRSRGGRIC
ncbi:hypothetical protein P4050_28120 [Pseudomonas aeruginosa]|nr:hypothetical protein [Pseudomonas aeruginosa]